MTRTPSVIFPAYEAIGKDIQLGHARWRLYMYLVHGNEQTAPILNHVRPVEVKATGLSQALHMSPRKVLDGLDWLTARGYIVECGRGDRRVRSLVLAWELEPEKTA